MKTFIVIVSLFLAQAATAASARCVTVNFTSFEDYCVLPPQQNCSIVNECPPVGGAAKCYSGDASSTPIKIELDETGYAEYRFERKLNKNSRYAVVNELIISADNQSYNVEITSAFVKDHKVSGFKQATASIADFMNFETHKVWGFSVRENNKVYATRAAISPSTAHLCN